MTWKSYPIIILFFSNDKIVVIIETKSTIKRKLNVTDKVTITVDDVDNVIWEICNKYLFDIICNDMGGLKGLVMCTFRDIALVLETQVPTDIYHQHILPGEVRHTNITILV